MKKSVLIVDDEEDLRSILMEIIESESFHCVEACSGQEALKILQNQKISLVISDINMPNGNGFYLLETMRENKMTLPFVFLSAYDSSEHKEKAKGLGVLHFIAKPFNPESIVNLIKQLLS
jgi:YesN/AraC family two-component response regulator